MAITYPLQFKAAILEKNNQPLTIDTVTFDGPLQVGQVLVRVDYSGICGKQLEEIAGSAGPDKFLPHMLGHEGSGTVVDTGPGVKKVKAGDTVVLHWMKGSGIDADTPLYHRQGTRVNAGWVTTFNEYAVVAENRVTPIHSGADMLAAALLGCAVTTGLGVVIYDANVRPGQTIAIFGCGGVGLNAIQAADMLNAYPVIAVDVNKESLAMAHIFGASHCIDVATTDPVQAIKELTDGKGVDVVIVAAAKPEVIEQAVQSCSAPGQVFLAAVPPAGAHVSLEAHPIHCGKRIDGSCGGGTFPDRDIPAYMALYERSRLKLTELISDTVSLDEINEGIQQVQQGTLGRCMVKLS